METTIHGTTIYECDECGARHETIWTPLDSDKELCSRCMAARTLEEGNDEAAQQV